MLNTCSFAEFNNVYFLQNYCIVMSLSCHLTLPCALKRFWKPVMSKPFTLAKNVTPM